MTNLNIIRAWKDDEYRATLTDADRALLPEHPAGLIELTDAALDGAAGGSALLKGNANLGTYPRVGVYSINVLACYGNLEQNVVIGPTPVVVL